MWPGWTMSTGRAFGRVATQIVCARSAAEMPVLTPLAASIETVKLVPCTVPLAEAIGGRRSCRACASVSVRHTRPRACLAMKLIFSGVTKSAANTRSPSFSRSSSSTSTTKWPLRISSTISSTDAIGVGAAGDGTAASMAGLVGRKLA